MTAKKRGLGRGLDALLGTGSSHLMQPREVPVVLQEKENHDGDMCYLPIEFLSRGRYQPRRDMDPDSLEELASSIRAQGIMQPKMVRSIQMTTLPCYGKSIRPLISV